MKKTILKNKYLFLLTLFLLAITTTVSVSFTVAKYTKTVDVGTIRLDFPIDPSSESFDGSYTVQKGDTLSGIAELFATTVEKLQAYNDIEGTLITEGEKINIPPQDYLIPESEATVPQETIPAETEPAPTEPSNTDSSNTSETEAPTLPEEPTDESVSVNTDDPTISE